MNLPVHASIKSTFLAPALFHAMRGVVRHLTTWLLLAPLLLLGLAGCNSISFGYNHADWLLRHWIGDYTSFNARQKEEIRREVDDYMRWHREHALPEYIAFLKGVDAIVTRDAAVSSAEVAHTRAEIGRLYTFSMSPLISPAAHLLSTLDMQQIEELGLTLAERNHYLERQALPGNRQQNLAVRAGRHLDLVEGLVGSLSDSQQATITAMSLRLPFITGDYIEEQKTRQARLIALLKAGADEKKIAALLRQWLEQPESDLSPQQQQTVAAYDRAMDDMVAAIFNQLTPEQKNHLHRKMLVYIEEFQKLNAVPPPEPGTIVP